MSFIRIALISLITMFFSIPGFSQDLRADEDGKTETSREKGLRKVASGQGHRDMEMNIHIDIDHEAIDKNIVLEIEHAMRSLEANLENIEIHIDPIEVNLPDLDLNMGELDLNLPDLDFDIEPIDIDLDLEDIGNDIEMEMEMNSHRTHHRDEREGASEDGKENERSKGLKKIN
jgi:hypothetical protein